jgi:hypothetical protein
MHQGAIFTSPNTVWGLMDSELYKDWFNGTAIDSKPSLQEIATYGPSGIRLGMLKDEGEDALMTHAKRFAWNEKASQNQTYNWDYKHTVGQPVCESTKNQILGEQDLTTYLKDTLFPMAHSVFEAPAAAYCSTWVIEYALWHILHYVHGEAHEETLIQLEREKLWKEQCDIQLTTAYFLRGKVVDSDRYDAWVRQAESGHAEDEFNDDFMDIELQIQKDKGNLASKNLDDDIKESECTDTMPLKTNGK